MIWRHHITHPKKKEQQHVPRPPPNPHKRHRRSPTGNPRGPRLARRDIMGFRRAVAFRRSAATRPYVCAYLRVFAELGGREYEGAGRGYVGLGLWEWDFC